MRRRITVDILGNDDGLIELIAAVGLTEDEEVSSVGSMVARGAGGHGGREMSLCSRPPRPARTPWAVKDRPFSKRANPCRRGQGSEVMAGWGIPLPWLEREKASGRSRQRTRPEHSAVFSARSRESGCAMVIVTRCETKSQNPSYRRLSLHLTEQTSPAVTQKMKASSQQPTLRSSPGWISFSSGCPSTAPSSVGAEACSPLRGCSLR